VPGRSRIRRAASVLGVALSVIGCSTAVPLSTPVSPPRVAVEPEGVDLGVVPLGEEAVAEFVVRNAGGSPLRLAAPALPRATRVEGLLPELAPGQAVRIRFLIDTANAIADSRQDLKLVTSDPAQESLTVRVRLDVRPFLAVRPGQARFITVQHAREGTISQTVVALDGASFRVLRVESPLPFVRVSFAEVPLALRRPELDGSQWRVDVTLPPDAPVGALSGMVVVHTDHPRQKRAFVSLSGFVRPILVATPPQAEVGNLDRRRTRPLQLLLKNFAEELIEVTGVSTDVHAVRAELEPVEPGRTWRVKLLPVTQAPLGRFDGKVLVRTASPKVPTFEIPLRGQLVEGTGTR